jgi:glycosyltransferase involved in cell wall biosynthesis
MTVSHGTKKKLAVLSLGYTLDLWDDPNQAFGDPLQGLTGYEDCMTYYAIIAHSPHRNFQPIQLGENFWAYATNAYTPFDSWLRMLYLGFRLTKRNPVDLIQVRESFFSGTVGLILSRWLRVPLHVCMYGTNPYDPYWGRQSWILPMIAPGAKAILRRAGGIQVDGSMTARLLAEAGIPSERIHVKPLVPGNLTDFVVAERDPELLSQLSANGRFKRFVLFVGRVDAQKNLALLVEVAARIAGEFSDVRFVIVGDGPQRRDLEAKTREKGLADTVLWAGPQSHQQVVKYMATCNVFALPSVYEGFARVLMEAGMAGMPIVTTEVSGCDDAVVNGKNGYIVPIGNADTFAGCVKEIISNVGLAADMGRESRRLIQALVERYSDPKLQVRIWEDVLLRSGNLQ